MPWIRVENVACVSDGRAGGKSMEQEGKRMTRDELIERIEMTRKEIQIAGPVRRRDLRKHLKRMLAQLAQYDRFQEAARQGVG